MARKKKEDTAEAPVEQAEAPATAVVAGRNATPAPAGKPNPMSKPVRKYEGGFNGTKFEIEEY